MKQYFESKSILIDTEILKSGCKVTWFGLISVILLTLKDIIILNFFH